LAIQRLRLKLAVEVRDVQGSNQNADAGQLRSTSQLWQSRAGNGRISVASSHADFPALLAEALDFLAAQNHSLANAAAALHISSSQLVRLLKQYAPALDQVNRCRAELGMAELK
jgi:hypothetical protein